MACRSLAIAFLALLACAQPSHAGGWFKSLIPGKYKADWVVTAGTAAPDGFTRNVILINGEFMPTLEVTQGDELEITLVNQLPSNWPSITSGISLHWHGWHMRKAQWYDGATYVTQCPVKVGDSFTYKFTVNEPPGTYLWHDHGGHNRGDGLQGALIVRPRVRVTEQLPSYDSESTLFLMDWWHFQGDAMGLRLNRPFDDSKVTNTSGSWYWIGLPKSVLINGKGSYADCEDVYTRTVNGTLPTGATVTPADVMTPTFAKAGQLGPAAAWPTCNVTQFTGSDGKGQREVIGVQAGKKLRLRLINGAVLVYMTVCIERHSVTLVALDGLPVNPQTFSECIDINSGQRADVIITADQPVGNYWISVVSQYRKGAPTGYAVLSYQGAPASPSALPGGALLQPQAGAARVWNASTIMSITTSSVALGIAQLGTGSLLRADTTSPPPTVTARYVVDTTQPLLNASGILRWALDNVMHSRNPTCGTALAAARADRRWAERNAMSPTFNGTAGYLTWDGSDTTMNGPGTGLQVQDDSRNPDAAQNANTPKFGAHVITITPGNSIEIVLQNNKAGAFGGEYPGQSPRDGKEQHPFHLHGYRFWVVGMGSGKWNESAVSTYNLRNPVYRDTATLLADAALTGVSAGWTALRFRASNPGVWLLHCHINAHATMGQGLWFVETPWLVGSPPRDAPACPAPCRYQMALSTPGLVSQAFGANNSMIAPDASLP